MRRNRRPSVRQTDFLQAVVALSAEFGRAPSSVEIAERLGISRQGATSQLRALERRGLIADVPKVVSSGTWAVTAAGAEALPVTAKPRG